MCIMVNEKEREGRREGMGREEREKGRWEREVGGREREREALLPGH